MGSLRILKVTYCGDMYEFISPRFDKKLAVVEGPNGSGKSTFFNLIYFCLGGKVEEFELGGKNSHTEITEDKNNYVLLEISVSDVGYSVLRKLNENLVTISRLSDHHTSLGISIETFPVFRRDSGTKIFSDWLLEKLGIPSVEIFQGGKNFKLNFADLSRLIYHNQAADPQGVFKQADNSNFLTDSLEIRRAIFQILVGKTLLSLYEAIGASKRAEQAYDSARSVFKEYQQIVGEILKERGIKEVINSKFLSDRLLEIDSQIDILINSRTERQQKRLPPSDILKAFEIDKRELNRLQAMHREFDQQVQVAIRDKSRLVEVIRSINEDLDRISKVIFTHEQLSLFSSDTCPYCLNRVLRAEGHCVCGHEVDENDYQRFFYSTSEYIDIYRAKRKSLETVQSAIENLNSDINRLSPSLDEIAKKIQILQSKIDMDYSVVDSDPYELVMSKYDEKIFELKEEQTDLLQALKMEGKLDDLQRKLDSKKKGWESAKNLVALLDAASREELRTRLAEFDFIYGEFMTAVLPGCRAANIDPDTYMPVINNGVYREASADVPKRFLYYLTLLKLSLKVDVPFPRLLLVDTPETAGIDFDNLVRMLRQIKTLDDVGGEYQVILSTGKNKFPPEFSDFVSIRLDDDSKLLQSRQ